MKLRSAGIAVLLAVAFPAAADDLHAQTNGELCVRRDMALMTGQPVAGNTEAELTSELQSRNETCEPTGFYVPIAQQRIQNLQFQAQLLAQTQQQQAELEAQMNELRHQDRSARVRNAANALLQAQEQQRQQQVQAPHPVQTTCRDTTVGVQCTTLP